MEGHVVTPAEAVRHGAPLGASAEAARVVELDTEIDAEEQDIEVQTQSYTVGYGNLAVELIPEEHAAGLRFVVVDRPVVAGIEERRKFDDRPHAPAVLEVEIKTDVADLQIVAGQTAVAAERARSERSCLPTAHTVGTAGEEPFLERHRS